MKTLDKYLDEMLEYRRNLNASEYTLRNIRSIVKRFILYLFGSFNVITSEGLRISHMESYLAHLSEYRTKEGLPLKPASINSRIKWTRAFLDYLFKHKYITSRLSDHLEYVKEPQFLPCSILTHRDVKKIIRRIDVGTQKGIRDRAAIEVLYSAGLRISELCSLKLEDIDLEFGVMKVIGKGQKERMVPVGKTALRHLTTYIRAVRPFLDTKHSRYVFLNAKGGMISQDSLRERIHDCAEKAKIEVNVTPHTFRRSCATEMIKSNANIYHVKELLGHETLSTLRHYAKLNINDLKKTHEKCHPRERDS